MPNTPETEYVQLKQSVYREYCRSYDEDRQRFVGGRGLGERVEWALEGLSPGTRLLDLGCGSGDVLAKALEDNPKGPAPVGMDLTPEMLALARQRLKTSCQLVQANAQVDSSLGLPLQDGSFDLVTSLNLIQELPKEAIPELLSEIHRVLKPGGRFRTVIPCMVGENPSSLTFRQLSLERGAMEFLFPEELEDLLDFNRGDGLVDREFRLGPSSAAAAAASGETRFRLFAQIMDEIRDRGLDPRSVTQGVMFFSARKVV